MQPSTRPKRHRPCLPKHLPLTDQQIAAKQGIPTGSWKKKLYRSLTAKLVTEVARIEWQEKMGMIESR